MVLNKVEVMELPYFEIKKYLENDYHKSIGVEYLWPDKTWTMPCGSLIDEKEMMNFVHEGWDMQEVFEGVDKLIKISLERR
jgi:hypothetical protein